MVEEARNTVEEEMRLANDKYKTCLLRMEVERAALDEKLSQRDAEINKLSTTLEELRSSVETQVTIVMLTLVILVSHTILCHKLCFLGKF